MLDPGSMQFLEMGDPAGTRGAQSRRDVQFEDHHPRDGTPEPHDETRQEHKGQRRKRFLQEVQVELEEQRQEWKDTIDQLTAGVTVQESISTGEVRKDTIVDTSSGRPVFKAYFDVHQYPRSGLSVMLDRLQDKVIVQAKEGGGSSVAHSFTQKVQLPRYADIDRMRSNLSADGILVVEVPLMFHFPKDQNTPIKSFVNQVKTRKDGSKFLEIIVNTDEYQPSQLRVQIVDDSKLVIMGGRKRIKQYTLPKNADQSAISSELTRQGKLAIHIPLLGTPQSSPDTTFDN